jgi:hypothetical protein
MTRHSLRVLFVVIAMTRPDSVVAQPPSPVTDAVAAGAKAALVKTHGDGERARIERGVDQVRPLWRASDGDAAAFQAFAEAEFLPQGASLDATFARL